MKKITKIIFSLILLLSWLTLRAAETYTVELGQFERLKIDANVSVVYSNHPDSTGMARFTAPEGREKLFLLTVKGNGTLRVQLGEDLRGNAVPPVLYVYSDFLTSVESSSDLSVFIDNPTPCATFNANQTGNGSIIVENVKCNNLTAALTTGNGTVNISGTCLNANFRMVGTGIIYADRLKADNVNCRILGTGSIGCWALDNLNVKGLGTTKIYYKGHPNIKKSGGGKLFDLQENSSQDKKYEEIGVPVTNFDNPKVNENEIEEDAEQLQQTQPSQLEEEEEDGDDYEEEGDENDEEEEGEDEDEEEEDDGYQTVVSQDD